MTIINSRNLTKTLLLSIITILTLTTISAAPAELFLYPGESTSQINGYTSYELEIENTGNVEDVYRLSHSEPGEITIRPEKIPEEGNLAPGETYTANVWFNPNAQREEGRHSFSLTATSRASGQTYSTNGVVNVVKDYQLQLETSQATQTACKGETATYNIDVTNTGTQPDEVKLTTNKGNLETEKINLVDGQTKTVKLEISNQEEINEEIEVIAESTKVTYASDKIDLEFTSENCYDSQINIEPETQQTAVDTQSNYTVELENKGTKEDTFQLETSEGELENTEITVEGQTTQETQLTYTPEELGTTQIDIQATGENSEAQKTVTNEAYNGMNTEVSFQNQRKTVCEDEETTMNAQIQNTGEAKDTYNLETNVDDQLSEETRQELLPDREIELEPNQTQDLQLNISSSRFEESSTQEIQLTATSQKFEETTNTGTTDLEIENCWDLEMNVIPEVQSAGENRSTVYEIRLENTGTKQNTYELGYQGPRWISIKPDEVTVPSGQTETSYMYAGAPFEKQGQVKITAEAEGTQIEKNQTVQLLLGEDVQEEIQSPENSISGSFRQAPTQLINTIRNTEAITTALISAITALVIALAILFKETRN